MVELKFDALSGQTETRLNGEFNTVLSEIVTGTSNTVAYILNDNVPTQERKNVVEKVITNMYNQLMCYVDFGTYEDFKE